MELIPLIYIENEEILIEKTSNPITLKDFLKQSENANKIYVLDLDGIKKDEPNLTIYQNISRQHELWIDNGPRDLDDIVDTTMAGATDITLRRNLCPNLDIPEIEDITDNKIFTNLDFTDDPSFYKTEGLVNFNSREEIEMNFKYGEFFKTAASKNKIYSYDSDPQNYTYWKNLGVVGLLVDFNKIREFENAIGN